MEKRHRGCSTVLGTTDDGGFIMSDSWICYIHKYITVNSFDAKMEDFLTIEKIERKTPSDKTPSYSVVWLMSPSGINVGDVFYTHSLTDVINYYDDKTEEVVNEIIGTIRKFKNEKDITNNQN